MERMTLGMAESMVDDQRIDTSGEFAVGANVYATIVDIDSPDYERFLRFQDERFARLQSTRTAPSPEHSPTYVEATHTLPSEIIPIIVRRRQPLHALHVVAPQLNGEDGESDEDSEDSEDELIGIARLELPGATLIESMIALREGSAAAEAIANCRAAEVGGFATLEGISRFEIIAVVDAVVGVLIQLARQRGLDWLWIFPRAAFMSLLRADIPGVLPPYHFILSPDVAGWRPTSAQLEAFRSMRLRGFLDMPLIYQIATETFAEDLQARMDCYDARMQLGAEIGPALGRAMITAQRTLRQEMELLYPSSVRGEAPSGSSVGVAPVAAGVMAPLPASQPVAQPAYQQSQPGEPTFLPEGLTDNLPLATYLRRVVSEGGAPAQAYKELSYSLLEIERGQRILDVGSGAGVDLLALAKLAGPTSTVVGLEINPTLVREARTLTAQQSDEPASYGNVLVFQGDAEHMTIPNGEFDRARTDRALQHFPNPQRALAEIWRVLKPGGILTLVEPDWGSMVVTPGSAVGEGDSTFSKALGWCRRHLAHPLMGRNLLGMLRGMPAGAWQSCKVVVAPFTFTDWKALDAVLLLSRAAAALQQEEPEHASEIEEWLSAVSTASSNGVFFGFIPMYYAIAVKSTTDKLPGAR